MLFLLFFRRNGMKTYICMCAVLFCAVCSVQAADEMPVFETRVTDVTVFKDGHALIMCRGTAEVKNGWCRTYDVPSPLLGAFWAFVADTDAEIDFLKSGLSEVDTKRPCLTIDELIRVNSGKKVKVKDTSDTVYEGTLIGIMEHSAVEEVETSRTERGGYDRYGRWTGGREIRRSSERNSTALSSFVMVRTGSEVSVIKRSDIRSVVIQDTDPERMIGAPEQKREIAVHVMKKGRPFTGSTEVGFVYIQKGIRWIPDYRIDIKEGSKARIRLQGTVINDITDFRRANVNLVVGVPSFCMKGELSPVALREVQPALSSYFRPPSERGSGSRHDYLSNAVMSQVAVPAGNAAERSSGGGGPDIPSEGRREDLFLYTPETALSMNKGERAVLKLLDVTVPYENIYTWELPPVPPREMWRHVGSRHRDRLEKNLSAPKVMHVLRLENTGTTPWTTGPATVFKGSSPLAQAILTYTSVKNRTDVSVTAAVDINTKKTEHETERRHNAAVIDGSNYTKVTLHGTLTVRNFKSKEITIEVRRNVIGSAKPSGEGGTSRVIDQFDNRDMYGSYYWYGWWPGWWYRANPISEIRWTKTVPAQETVKCEYSYFYYTR